MKTARHGGSVRRTPSTQRRSAKYITLDDKPLPTLPAPIRISVISQRTLQLQARQSARRRDTLARVPHPLNLTSRAQTNAASHGRPRRRRSVRAGELTPILMAEAFGELTNNRRTPDGLGNKHDLFIAPKPLEEGEIHPALRRGQSRRYPKEQHLRFDLKATAHDHPLRPRQRSQRKQGLRGVRSVPDLLHRLQPNLVRNRKKAQRGAEDIKPTDQEDISIQTHDEAPGSSASGNPLFIVRYLRKYFTDRKSNLHSTTMRSAVSASESTDPSIIDGGEEIENSTWGRPTSRVISARPVKRKNSKLSGRHSIGTIRRQMFPAGRNVGQKEEEDPATAESQRLEQESLKSKYDKLLMAAKKRHDLKAQEAEPPSPLSVRCRGEDVEAHPTPETGLGLEMDIRPDLETIQSPQEERKDEHTGYDVLLFQEATMGDSYFGSFDPGRWSVAELEEQRPVTPALTADIEEPAEANGAGPSRAQSVAGSQGVGRTSSMYSAQSTKLEGVEADNWVHVGPEESIPISPETLLDSVSPYLLYSEQQEKTSPSLSPSSGILYISNPASEMVPVRAGSDFTTIMTPTLQGH